jgi:hypothetical protein
VIALKPRTRLEGDYWTERKTRGHIATNGYSKRAYDDFASAQKGSYS